MDPHQYDEESGLHDFFQLQNDSQSTISTNATASNLAGAGRTLGLAFDWAGRRIERLVNSAAMFQVQDISQSTISTNATAPNLVGAGRTLGLAFDWAGRRIETLVNNVAVKGGYGPDMVTLGITHIREVQNKKITATRQRLDEGWPFHETCWDWPRENGREGKTIAKKCRQLLQYTRSAEPSSFE